MRNLKRALSLTLASVMLLGMMVVGSSAAAGYDDVAETDNVEAIEVLQAIEVMVGDERGFGPDRPVNRAEMAVVMGKLLSLDYNYYSTSCPFNDVYDWARGWVGACYANKIVSGRGEGVYDPGATVTAVEAASMLMRALGYFQYQNDYQGGFELATVTQGTKIHIFDGVGSSATAPMTRNQVAQMVLNALQSAVVEPDGNTINLTTPDGTVLTGKVNYVSVTSQKSFARAIGKVGATSIGSANDGYIVELGEQLYNGKLQLNDDIDPFNRPARKWEYDGKGIGTYVKKELMEKEYVGEVTGKDLYDLLGKSVIEDYELDVAIDGVTDPAIVRRVDSADAYNTDFVFNASDLNRNNKAGVGRTGTGVLTQVFVDPDEGQDGKVWIAIINTYLARASQNYDSRREELPVTGYSIRKDGASSEYVKVPKTGAATATFRLGAEEFPAVVDAKENDAFLFTVAEGEIQSFVPAEVLSGVQISSFKRNDNVVVDGTTYKFDTTAGFDPDALKIYTDLNATGVINLKDLTYNVYLDQYGNLIGVEEVDAVKNYVFITAIDLNDSNLVNGTADARAIFLDGTTDTIRVNMAKSDLDYWTTNNNTEGYHRNSILNTWCTYTKNDSNVYTIKQVADVNKSNSNIPYTGDNPTSANNTSGLAQYHQTNGAFDIDKKHITLNGKNAPLSGEFAYVYGNEDTVYITAELDELTNQGGTWGVISDVETVTTGVENVNLTVWTHAQAIEEAEDKGTIANTKASSGVYTLYDDDGIVIGAVVVGEDNGTAKNLVYVHTGEVNYEAYNGTGSSRAAGDGLFTWTRDVISNGEKITLTEVSDGDSDLAKMVQYHWYQIKTNGKGEVTGVYKLPGVAGESAKLKEANLDRFDDYALDWDSDFTPPAGKPAKGDRGEITYTVQEGASTILYYNADTINSRMRMNGRTLYVHTQDESGFVVSNNVKWLITRWDSNKKQSYYDEGTGAASLKTMIDEINNRHPNNENYLYQVSAVIESGIASSVVIRDEYNDYNRPETPSGGKGNVETVLSSTASVDYTVSDLGRLFATFQYQAPDYAAATKANGTANTASVVVSAYALNSRTNKYDILVGRSSTLTANLNATGAGQFSWLSNILEFDPSQDLRFAITTETLGAVKVNYVDADNKSIDNMMTADTTKIIDVKAPIVATDLEAAIDSAKFTGGAIAAATSVTGITGGTLETSGTFVAANGSEEEVYSAVTGTAVAGTSAVTVKFDVSGLGAVPTTYTVAKSTTFATDHAAINGAVVQTSATPVALSNFGVTGATDTLKVEWAPAGSFAPGASVKFTATVSGVVSATSYDVTIQTSAGNYTIEDISSTGKDSAYIPVTGDITINNVTARIHTPNLAKLAVKDVSINEYGTEITFTFNTGVSMTDAETAVGAACFSLETNTNTAAIIGVTHTAGNETVTVKLDKPLADDDVIQVKNTVLNAARIADKATAQNITIGLTDGVYSVKTVADA